MSKEASPLKSTFFNKTKLRKDECAFLGNIVIGIRACNVRDPGPIPGWGVAFGREALNFCASCRK